MSSDINCHKKNLRNLKETDTFHIQQPIYWKLFEILNVHLHNQYLPKKPFRITNNYFVSCDINYYKKYTKIRNVRFLILNVPKTIRDIDSLLIPSGFTEKKPFRIS